MGRPQVQSHGAPVCTQVTTIIMIMIIKINILVKISLTTIIIVTAKSEDPKCRAPEPRFVARLLNI